MRAHPKRYSCLAMTVALLCCAAATAGAEDAPPDAVARCDALAASPLDPDKPPNLPGVEAGSIDAPAALEACQAALAIAPQLGRIPFQLARINTQLSKHREAMVYNIMAFGRGHIFSAFDIATAKGEGRGVAKDESEALMWLGVGAARGSPLMAIEVGRMARDGRGGAASPDFARQMFTNAGKLGHFPGYVLLAGMALRQQASDNDKSESRAVIEAAADNGNADAGVLLSLLLEESPPNRAASRARYAANKDKARAEAFLEIARALQNGDFGDARMSQAKSWFERAAARGSVEATEALKGMTEAPELAAKPAKSSLEAPAELVLADTAGQKKNGVVPVFKTPSGGRRLYSKDGPCITPGLC